MAIKGFPSTMNDEYQMNLIKVLRYAAATHGDTDVVSYRTLQDGEVHRLNYAEMYRRVCAMANALEKLGVKPGDRIGILGWNDHRYLESYFSISGLGAVMVNLNIRLHIDELSYIVDHAGIKALFVDNTLLPLAESLAEKRKFDFIVLMSDKGEYESKLQPIYWYEDLIKDNPDDREWEEIDETSAATACYTSGTTGLPKGVFYSHRAMILHGLVTAATLPVTIEDTFLPIVPLFHVNGWCIFPGAMATGARIVLPGRYTPDSLADIISKEKVTLTNGVPTIHLMILEALRKIEPKPRLDGLRVLIGGSEPPLSLMKGYAEFGAKVIQLYGATEASPLVTINKVKQKLMENMSDEDYYEHQRKQGLPLFGLEVKLVDPDREQEVPWDGKSVGELWVRGHWIIKEYYNDPRTKEQCMPDGWWRSGDAAVIDKNGYVKLVDRLKDVIKSGGEWISSVDMENLLMTHPAVLEATVVGIPHPKWDERPLALVVLKPEYKDKPAEEIEKSLREWLLQRFAKWQLPDKILFVDEIPKTSVGKFAKRIVREQYKDLYMKEAA